MSERINLSLWFRTQPAGGLLARLGRAVESLPPEVQKAGIRTLAVVPISWSEPALIDEAHADGVPVAEALERLHQAVHEDSAVELGLDWPLWTWNGSAWAMTHERLAVTALAPAFDPDMRSEHGDLRLDFGFAELYLGELAPADDEDLRPLEFNILRLLGVAHAMQQRLHPERRRLWSEDDADIGARLIGRLRAVHA